jgi:hypothetical protein
MMDAACDLPIFGGERRRGIRVANSLDKAEVWASKRDEGDITRWNGLLMFGGDHHETEIG